MASKRNPFYQPPRQWQIRIFVPHRAVPFVEEAFEDSALAISSFEIDEQTAEWYVDILTDRSPQEIDVAARLALVSGLQAAITPRYEIKDLEAKDWVGEVERSFPPLCVGRFYVHGSHITASAPHGKIALQVNAGAAFGSGEHATTSGCLLALNALARRRRFLRPLDMGCGSGILAVAMAKLWHVGVVGIDIDPVSVAVARENARNNRVQKFTAFATGNGYKAELVRKSGPFDLIVANILARPLVKMSPSLVRNLRSGGMIVLSGLLDYQESQVLNAHRSQGMRLLSRIRQHGWCTLIMEKR